MTQPTLYMLVGLPASGKTYWSNAFVSDQWEKAADLDQTAPQFAFISTDDIVQKEADRLNKTYNEVWPNYVSVAEKQMYEHLKNAIAQGKNIIWDQTNLTKKKRAQKLAQIPSNYRKIAVVFKTPDPEEHARRLNSRPGKTIASNIIEGMVKSYEAPYFDEGFDEIWYEN